MYLSDLSSDLEFVLNETRPLWEEMRGKKIFITGGTGFFGKWILESFAYVNDTLNLGAEAVVLTRDPSGFKERFPRLGALKGMRFLQGDVLSLGVPKEGFDYCIHGATSADAKMIHEHPLLMFDTIVNGTRKVLEFAQKAGVEKCLFESSGAVYGPQLHTITHVQEDWLGGPDLMNLKSVYGEGKRAAEHLCAIFAHQSGMEVKIARCFAFVGPHLPVDGHYAIGNFIGNALKGGPIRVGGDGTPHRSYLYTADLMVWLWTILIKGETCRPYNVGSEESLSIRSVAEKVGQAFSPSGIEINVAREVTPGSVTERYVPSTHRARTELGLVQKISMEEALIRSVAWWQGRLSREQNG